jgi:hypothetical protein
VVGVGDGPPPAEQPASSKTAAEVSAETIRR